MRFWLKTDVFEVVTVSRTSCVSWSWHPPLFLSNPMPTPKVFKSFSSKSNPSETSPTPDVLGNEEKDGSPQTVTVNADGPIPEYSDSLKGAWIAAHREMPQAQGTEKVLNKIGMLIIYSSIHAPHSRRPSVWILYQVLTSTTGKGVSRTV